eukprot:CCRYP_021121-RA/>CCRYP_021121-RA protein AED:0.42 eAED:0.42 QI:0/0/0/1/1/1/2/0/211
MPPHCLRIRASQRPFDYNKMPLAPMGCNAQVHEKTDSRGTWAFHCRWVPPRRRHSARPSLPLSTDTPARTRDPKPPAKVTRLPHPASHTDHPPSNLAPDTHGNEVHKALAVLDKSTVSCSTTANSCGTLSTKATGPYLPQRVWTPRTRRRADGSRVPTPFDSSASPTFPRTAEASHMEGSPAPSARKAEPIALATVGGDRINYPGGSHPHG